MYRVIHSGRLGVDRNKGHEIVMKQRWWVIMMTERRVGKLSFSPEFSQIQYQLTSLHLPSGQGNKSSSLVICLRRDSEICDRLYPRRQILSRSRARHSTYHIDFSTSSCSHVFFLNSCLSITPSHAPSPETHCPLARNSGCGQKNGVLCCGRGQCSHR